MDCAAKPFNNTVDVPAVKVPDLVQLPPTEMVLPLAVNTPAGDPLFIVKFPLTVKA